MLYHKTYLMLAVLLMALLATTSALRKDNREYDDDDDRHMHPVLPALSMRSVPPREGEDTNNFWYNEAKSFIHQQAVREPNIKVAKNVILFLGDGMGLATLAAARSYIGGEHDYLSFERFPYTGLSKTYSVDKIVPDSACTATAYLCGVKANYGTIGVNGKIARDDCEAMRDANNHVYSIAKWAMDAGKSAGLVTTTRVTHASPSAVYAHTADREWENDSELASVCGDNSGLEDIAQQLIHGDVGSKLKVMLGGGKRQFYAPEHYQKGYRKDGRNLVQEYQSMSTGNAYVETRDALFDVDLKTTSRLLGIFSDSHMDYHLDALANAENTQPTLEEMTARAIEHMQTEDKGYFLFIEGGKIDLGHHGNKARLALDETAEFSKAIELARQMTSEEDTLIVVTSDHSHTFSLAGYQPRGSDIFSAAPSLATDDIPYMPLSYTNGPGFDKHFSTAASKRVDPNTVLTGAASDVFPATVPLGTETHGGEDVGVFASGPWAHLFTGVYEQNTIPHMMAYAACVGDGLKACDA